MCQLGWSELHFPEFLSHCVASWNWLQVLVQDLEGRSQATAIVVEVHMCCCLSLGLQWHGAVARPATAPPSLGFFFSFSSS